MSMWRGKCGLCSEDLPPPSAAGHQCSWAVPNAKLAAIAAAPPPPILAMTKAEKDQLVGATELSNVRMHIEDPR